MVPEVIYLFVHPSDFYSFYIDRYLLSPINLSLSVFLSCLCVALSVFIMFLMLLCVSCWSCSINWMLPSSCCKTNLPVATNSATLNLKLYPWGTRSGNFSLRHEWFSYFTVFLAKLSTEASHWSTWAAYSSIWWNSLCLWNSRKVTRIRKCHQSLE